MIFVAEIGMNYDGNFDIAYELIRQAKWAGANIAKFQFGWRDKPGEINCIDIPRAKKLKEWCDYWEIEMMVSPISESGFELAQSLDLRRYKIASRTVVDNPDLVKRVLDQDKETFISLGFWKKEVLPFGNPNNNMRYIFCQSSYPAYPEELKHFPKKFTKEKCFGYSDHCHGISACLLAISRGARFVEKHFTLNKTSPVLRDHILSATPEEFRKLVDVGRELGRLVEKI